MTHVFIVSAQTFKYHLEYMFAGTGAGEKEPVFLANAGEKYNASTEKNLVGMIADISRVRTGDKIIFYLTGCAKFYGFFRVRDIAFADIKGIYLSSELKKNLTFRVLLEPADVYTEGITEQQCLEDLDGIQKPYEMCWSLIYRKLTGNRGCTAVFDYEADRIDKLIKIKNSNIPLNGYFFSYDSNSDKIITITDKHDYTGTITPINIKERLLKKALSNNAFEVHLQAYIMQMFEEIKPFLGIDSACWFANEISCGFGMQRIDIMAVTEDEGSVKIKIMELKSHISSADIIYPQLSRYIKWCSDYVAPNFGNKKVIIEPIVIARAFSNDQDLFTFKNEADRHKMTVNNAVATSPQFISFTFDSSNIIFKKEF